MTISGCRVLHLSATLQRQLFRFFRSDSPRLTSQMHAPLSAQKPCPPQLSPGPQNLQLEVHGPPMTDPNGAGILMLTWLGYIDGIHGTPYIAAPWIMDPMGYGWKHIENHWKSLKQIEAVLTKVNRDMEQSWTISSVSSWNGVLNHEMPGSYPRCNHNWYLPSRSSACEHVEHDVIQV